MTLDEAIVRGDRKMMRLYRAGKGRKGMRIAQVVVWLMELKARIEDEKAEGDTDPGGGQESPPEGRTGGERGDIVLPIPCTNVPEKTVKDWFRKINEELDEMKAVALSWQYGDIGGGMEPADANEVALKCVAYEAADTITAITSMLEAMGIDEGMRQDAQRLVNERNRERGRIAC